MTQGIILQYFHWYLPHDGKLWLQIKEEAERLKELGFSAIWFPPAAKGTNGIYSEGYDIYDLYDLGEFDQKGSVRTKYGTKQEFIDAINEVHRVGMQAMVDIVLNHKSGGDEIEKIPVVKVNPDDRTKDISAPMEIEAYTKFNFPGRGEKYSSFKWDYKCFTGVDYAKDQTEWNIYRILNGFGDGWEPTVDNEKGNFDYLMYNDVEFRNPAVVEELDKWGKWYWDQVHFDAVRLDAVKHISCEFYLHWLKKLRENTGQEIFAVGEYWAPGFLDKLLNYLKQTNDIMSLFDSSLHQNFFQASHRGNTYDLTKIFDQSLVQVRPDKAVTVVSNHDTQPLQSLEAPIQPWFKPLAYALILLRDEGYPCVFYPDLYGANYKDTGRDGNEYEIHMPKIEELENILIARVKHAYGLQRDYFDHPNCIGWTREGNEQFAGCAVVLSNGDHGNKNMEIGKRYAGKKFKDLLQKVPDEIIVNEEGWANFLVAAGSVSVWVPSDSL